MTIIVNLFGAPGSGKSTTRAGLFYKLKINDINCEEIPEYPKDLTWEERKFTLGIQQYIFGKQLRNILRVINKVDVIVTDCPLMMISYYAERTEREGKVYPETFYQYMFDQTKQLELPNKVHNFFMVRAKKYNPVGRNQTEEESNQLSLELQDHMKSYRIPYTTVKGDKNAVDQIYRYINPNSEPFK